MEKEKISVIVPVFNGEKTCERCIKSITGGGYRNIEVIVVNDGSTDGTERIVQSLCASDDRIRLISQENRGPAGSRETGLQNATGNYVAWCDADDWYEPMYLTRLHKLLVEREADIAICRSQIPGHESEDKTNPKISEWKHDEAIAAFFDHKEINGVLWSKLIRRELYEDVHFDLSTWYWEDLMVVWKVLQRAKKVVRTEERLYNFYIHDESMCAKQMNEKRIFSDLKVWDSIVNDCKSPDLSDYYNMAVVRRASWLSGELSLMIRDGYEDRFVVKQFQQRMKYAGFDGVKAQNGLSKYQYILKMTSFPLVRVITKILKR